MNQHPSMVTVAPKQRGATLIVSLIILAVITVLGLASIRNSSLEMKMAASARDRAVAFQRAESTLIRVERMLQTEPPPFNVSHVLNTCVGNKCFNPSCDNGLCFAGEYDGGAKSQCRLAPHGGTPKEFWKDETIWKKAAKVDADNPAKHMLAQVGTTRDAVTAQDVQYIIEFMCFVPRAEQIITGANKDGGDDVPLYRITVRAEGEASRSTVLMQSTFRVAE